ncbi:MAG: VCBS repeat-containing protein [Planctomycetota bacterium]
MIRSLLFACCVLAAPGFAQNVFEVSVTEPGSPVPGWTTERPVMGKPGTDRSMSTLAQLPGWPIRIGSDVNMAPRRGVVLCDLDGDGIQELLTSSTDRKLYAWHADGTPVIGFPVTLNEKAEYPPTVGDVDRDGDLEIAQFTRGFTSGSLFYLFDHRGVLLPGFPVSVSGNNIVGSPVMADLDEDGQLEILAAESQFQATVLHVFEGDGSEWGGNWPVTLIESPSATPAVGDVDADGHPEIVVTTLFEITLYEADGTRMPGWGQSYANARFGYGSAALADIDGDDDLEIFVGAQHADSGVLAYHHDGTIVSGWPQLTPSWSYCPPTIADIDGDGQLDILGGEGAGPTSTPDSIWAWNGDGSVKAGFPYQPPFGGGTGGAIIVADIDSDGQSEIFADYKYVDGTQGFLLGIDSQGNALPGFPLRPNGNTYMNGPTIGDLNGDGRYDLAFLSFRDDWAEVNVYDLGGSYAPIDVAWSTYHHENERDGDASSSNALTFLGHAQIGNGVALALDGAPGDTAFLWASLGTSSLQHPTFGWFHLSLTPIFLTIASNVVTPANGELLFPLAIPNNPSLVGRDIRSQGLLVSDLLAPSGEFTNLVGVTIQ